MRPHYNASKVVATQLLVALLGCASSDGEEESRSITPRAGSLTTPPYAQNNAEAQLPVTAWYALSDSNWSDWYTYLPSVGRDVDPAGVFRVEDGVLHILGFDPSWGDQEFGYIATRSEFANYRLKIEQRWGTRKFAPRAGSIRDSGLLYHMRGPDQIWPQSAEFQVQERDTGDFYMLGSVGATVPLDPDLPYGAFKEGGIPTPHRSSQITKGGTYDSLTEWNQLELVVSGREFIHIVNGSVNHRGWDLEALLDGNWSPLESGRIAIQAEGAEVYYRNATLQPLFYAAAPLGAAVLFDGTNLDAWREPDASGWRVAQGELEVEPGAGSLVSREAFGDVRLHLEYLVPAAPSVYAADEAPGRSGVFLQGRYEVQVPETLSHELEHPDGRALYDAQAAQSSAALPAGVWQSYDIVFRAARFEGTEEREPARMSLVWNGTEIQRALALPASASGGEPESAGPAPLRLESHGGVRYRNIWAERLAPEQ